MAQTNYYVGVKRGTGTNLRGNNLTAGTSSAGTAVDIELNMQIVNNVTATGLTKKDVIIALEQFRKYILSNAVDFGAPGSSAGANLPAL